MPRRRRPSTPQCWHGGSSDGGETDEGDAARDADGASVGPAGACPRVCMAPAWPAERSQPAAEAPSCPPPALGSVARSSSTTARKLCVLRRTPMPAARARACPRVACTPPPVPTDPGAASAAAVAARPCSPPRTPRPPTRRSPPTPLRPRVEATVPHVRVRAVADLSFLLSITRGLQRQACV
jgi:hypothetical protein